MSAYDEFRSRKIKILSVFVIALVAFGVGAWFHDETHPQRNQWLMLAFFLIMFVGIMLYAYSFRCPRCRHRISAADVPDDGYIHFPNYCSHCGLDFMSVTIRNEPI